MSVHPRKKNILDNIQQKGSIEVRKKDGEMQYCNAPLVVGMYEFKLKRLTVVCCSFIKAYQNH
jgi:hypothetical protein